MPLIRLRHVAPLNVVALARRAPPSLVEAELVGLLKSAFASSVRRTCSNGCLFELASGAVAETINPATRRLVQCLIVVNSCGGSARPPPPGPQRLAADWR